jgi:hypothetical protein
MFWIIFFCLFAIAFSPGCVCCGSTTCLVFADTFATNDLSSNWTTATNGTWTIAAGVMSCSTTGGYRIATAQQPAGTQAMIVKADCSGSSGDLARVIGGWQDSSNFIYGQVKFGTFIQVIQVAGGSSTTISSSLGNFGSATYTLCISEDGLTASFLAKDTAGTLHVAAGTITSPSAPSGAGLGTGATAASVTFDNFSFSRTDSTCPATCKSGAVALCPICVNDGGQMSAKYAVTYAGIGELTPSQCSSDCGNLNQTTVFLGTVVGCQWSCIGSPSFCTVTILGTVQIGASAFAIFSAGGGIGMKAVLYAGSGGDCSYSSVATFDNSSSPGTTCILTSPLMLPLDASQAMLFCDYSGASCMVSSV